jgi:hypothetical protein
MSNDPEQSPENYATKIIAIFGGLTAMSHAINRPIPTIQGWGRRGCIPALQQQNILDVARNLNLRVFSGSFFEHPEGRPEAEG